MNQRIHWSVIVAYFYCVLILLVNISALAYTDYEAKQIKKNYDEYKQQQQAEQVEQDNYNQYPILDTKNSLKESVQPILDAGEAAKTATPILLLNIGVSLFTSVLLLLPTFFIKKVEDFVYKYDASINIDAYQKFILIIFICNLLVIFFDFLTVKSYFDFANAIVK